jgi:hypothetical protein
MISSQAHDLAGALAKSLGLDDQSSIGEACHPMGCRSLYGLSDKESTPHLKVRVHLHDDNELHSPSGVEAAELPMDADPRQAVHEVDQGNDQRRLVGKRLVRTVAFGVLTSLMVGAAFAWQLHGDFHRAQMASPSSNIIPVKPASKISDRVPAQDHAAAPVLPSEQTSDRVPTQDQPAPILPPEQVSVAPGPSPELQQQLESMASDIAVVRHIVERLAAIQEQMAVDIAMLQKSGQRASLPPPSVPAPSRKSAPNIERSGVAARSPSAPALTAPAQIPLALH